MNDTIANVFVWMTRPSLCLCVYMYIRLPQALLASGSVVVNYVHATEITEEDHLALKQSKTATEVCKYRVSVFSSRAHHVLSAETDLEMQSWIDCFNTLLASRFSAAELEAKRQAALVRLAEEAIAALAPLTICGAMNVFTRACTPRHDRP